MYIKFLKKSHDYALWIETDKFIIEEDISEKEWCDENSYIADISTEVLDQFTTVLGDLIYYRKKEYDSSDLILLLFDKLPQEKIEEVLKTLNDEYSNL